MQNPRLIKVGGVFALIVAVMQIVGNGLHPPIPPDTVEALQVIASTGPWEIVHLIILISYFMFIPFVIGAAASFQDQDAPLVRIGTPLIIVGGAIGAAQISTHLTIFRFMALQYVATSDAASQADIVFLYNTLWPYSVVLEIAHLLAIFIAAMMFGVAMLRETVFPKWVGWLGTIGGGIAAAGILVGKLVIHSRVGDIVFGVGLLPAVIWIIIVGIALLRLKAPSAAPTATAATSAAR